MNCHNCQSTNLIKFGKDRHQRQRWKCQDCDKVSSEGADLLDSGGGRKPKKWANDAERMKEYRKRLKGEL